jgi:hypothetical protein
VLAPNPSWSALRAQAQMSLFPGVPAKLQRALVAPLDQLSKAAWAVKRRIRGGDDAMEKQRGLETAGGFYFIARRPDPSASP